MANFHRPLKGRGAAKKTEWNGMVFDSKGEANHAAMLDLLKQSGEIKQVLYQVPFWIGDPGVDKPFKVDFVVVTPSGHIWAEDYCGVITTQKQRRIRQWRKRGPFELRVIRGKGKVEVIMPENDQ